MKFQWTWIIGILFALIIAIFSVVNVESVPVNYVFGTSEWPLVLVILGSALLGAAVSGIFALIKAYKTQQQMKQITKKLKEKELKIQQLEDELTTLGKKKPIQKKTESLPTIKQNTQPENEIK